MPLPSTPLSVRSSFVGSSFVGSVFVGSSFVASVFASSSFHGSNFAGSFFVASVFDGSPFVFLRLGGLDGEGGMRNIEMERWGRLIMGMGAEGMMGSSKGEV